VQHIITIKHSETIIENLKHRRSILLELISSHANSFYSKEKRGLYGSSTHDLTDARRGVKNYYSLRHEYSVSGPITLDSSLECRVGMDSDVWKSELSVFVSTKNVNVDIHSYSFLIWMYSNPICNIIRIRHYPNYPTKI
jgi:hypothetical protein